VRTGTFVLSCCLLIVASGAAAEPATALRVVTRFDSAELAPDSPDRLPRTIWRSGPNMVRIEGIVSAETGHKMLLVANSPHLWLADLESATGSHTVDPGPEIGAEVPVFPLPIDALSELQIGNESDYFREHRAQPKGRTSMDGRACERQDIETPEYLLVGCFEPFTGRPVAIGVRVGTAVMAVTYLEYDRNAQLPEGAFSRPPGVEFMDRPHQGETHAAQ
jgi:hypothetical protein